MTVRSNVLILIKGLGLGGAERLLVDALPYLDRARFAYHVAYLLPWKATLAPYFTAADLPIYCLGGACASGVPTSYVEHGTEPLRSATNGANPITAPRSWQAATLLPRSFAQLARLHRRIHFDLIHADLPVAGILARLIGRRYGMPVVYTEHNLQERYHPLTRWLNGATFAWNTRVLAVSDEVHASIGRAGLSCKTQVVTLLNGVPVAQVRAEAGELEPLRKELGIPDDHCVVGTVAVFRRQKRLADWLAVAAQVAAQRADVTFLLVGDGAEMPAVKAQIASLGLQERICLPGFREEGRRYLGLMDVYLMTSEFEGLPIALLEAMALAKPVVATAVGGIPEAVVHGREGLLTPAGAITQLAHYVLDLLDDAALRHRLGQAAAAQVEAHFHIKQRVRAIEELYEEILAK